MYVVLADDQVDVRRALTFVLEHECDLQLACEACNADELLHWLSGICPDLVLLDWELPGGGRGLICRMRQIHPGVKIIALSVNPEAQEKALSAGVQGFVSKGDPPERLLEVVRAVRASTPI